MISDLAYADLVHDGRPAPSIFQVPGARELAVEFFTVSKSYSMPGWRVGFCVGNRTLVGALATIKGYLDYGIFGPAQLAAATALGSCDADVAANRALYKHRAALLCDGLAEAGWNGPAPGRFDVRLGAPAAPRSPTWARSSSRPSCSRGRSGSRGAGGGLRPRRRRIRPLCPDRKRRSRPPAPRPPSAISDRRHGLPARVDKAAGLK